jgi:hypothetical protein
MVSPRLSYMRNTEPFKDGLGAESDSNYVIFSCLNQYFKMSSLSPSLCFHNDGLGSKPRTISEEIFSQALEDESCKDQGAFSLILGA